MQIKSFPSVTKILLSIIAPSIKEGGCYDAWKIVARHCATGISHIQGTDFEHLHCPVAHADSLLINIAITAMHKLTDIIMGVSNAFQNKNVPIHERVCVSLPPYYLDWFESSHPNVSINQYDGLFCVLCKNVIQGTNPSKLQWNRILDAVFTIIKYIKRKS